MSRHTYPYAVFGFSENLDWNILHFVTPIDDIRVCSACRVVAKKAAFLPCRHVLCEPCYEQWNPRAKVCFLDGDQCPQNEVYWREFPVERMMKRELPTHHIKEKFTGGTSSHRLQTEALNTALSRSLLLRRCSDGSHATMPSHTYPYAVFGFSENLDWSTIHFVKPIDDIRVCSACRVVARKAAFLPCRHVLCEPCYAQWKPRVKVCFLDGELCPENEVYWREFPVDRMMKCEVRCWNEENGCEAITDVSSIAEHFHRDCTHHSTCCPKCSSTVPRKNIVAHLESHCASHMLSRKSTGSPIKEVSAELVEFRKSLCSIELALRSPTQTNTSSPSTLQATHACHVENLNPLLTMAADVKQVSLLTKQALSLAKEKCEWRHIQPPAPDRVTQCITSPKPAWEAALRRCAAAMPSDTYSYVVFGFDENLDWRTIHFVKPIDDIRVCSACRVVARKAAFLPCRHVLCEPCYEQWKPRVKVCFLDGEVCPENEVYWREFPVDKMMKCEVRCWNRENGCETITEVSNIAVHFHEDCTYHTTCCARCSSTVLRKNIVAHLESHCVSHMLSRKRTRSPVDGVSKELVEVGEGIRGIERALRSYTHTNSLVPSTLQATQTNHEDNLNSLFTVATEVKQVSLLTEEALSLVKANRETAVNQAVHLKTAEASLSVELDKIANAAKEWSRCETSANRENAELEEHLGKLTLLRREIEVVSSRLGEFRDKVYPEAAIAARAVAGGLSEARVSKPTRQSLHLWSLEDMAPDTYTYVVFGFSENLDWNILDFVKPIDDIRVCSACRVVARKAAFLPCRHVLCEPCYEQWKPRVKVCFLDGELCPENEVYWREFPVERMMKSEVSCWNRKNGCETITDVSSIAEHYHRECMYHSTCCPQCSSTVLRKDIIAHLESHCVAHVVNIRSRILPSEAVISKDVVNIRDCLRSIETALRNVSHTNTSVASSLAGTTSHEENLHSLLTIVAEVKQVSEATKRALSVVGRSTERSTTQIADLKALKARSSAELEEIERAARESGSSEASANQGNADLEQSAGDMQVLQNDMQVLSSKLREVANEVSREASIMAAAAAESLSEVPSCEVLSWRKEVSRTSASPRVRTRVLENALKALATLACLAGGSYLS
ncbi:hypothetical protein HPB50_018959 [Hyalomma asiaticum]|uniref:Uncharacterized protein n=1 Tax=Hyalomma asiaticum TaxID=266040 RepID=A0ACB7RPA6_HYAAI|nr:hypothetical protein HPB50_018959 [Hyalomma asiaticum]